MAVSQIEEKILGRLAKHTEPTNALLSASLYQVLGLSILLSKKLYRARKLRKLDGTRDTKSLLLYHHIIWLSREGLSILEVYILPYCQDADQGAEFRVMAAKLRASLYHVFCLFHNNPPLSGSSDKSTSPPKDTVNGARSPKDSADHSSRRKGKAALRDPIPSIQSDTSFVTNPYAPGRSRTPPSAFLAVLVPEAARRTPVRPPGLLPINVSASQTAASFLLPPLNFVPMAREHFETAQHLAESLLPVTHALRLSVALEHSAFLWDCAKEHDKSRRLAKRTIRDVYTSSDGLDDDEFADASILIQSLAGLVKRASKESPQPDTSQPSASKASISQLPNGLLHIDRTIPISPPSTKTANSQTHPPTTTQQPSQIPHPVNRKPERKLFTVPETSAETSEAPNQKEPPRETQHPPPTPARTPQERASSITSTTTSDKASKRKLVEQAEEQARQRQRSRSTASSNSTPKNPSSAARTTTRNGSLTGDSQSKSNNIHPSRNASQRSENKSRSGSLTGESQKSAHSRQATPIEEGYVRKSVPQKKQVRPEDSHTSADFTSRGKNDDGSNRAK